MIKKNLSHFFNDSKPRDYLLIFFGFFLPISPSISSIIITNLFLIFLFSENKIVRFKSIIYKNVPTTFFLFFSYLIISSFWFIKNHEIIDLNSSYIYELNKILILLLCPFLFLFNFSPNIIKRSQQAFILSLITTALLSFFSFILPSLNFLFKSGHYNDEFYFKGFIDHSDLSIFFCFGIFIVLNEIFKKNKKKIFLWPIVMTLIIFLLNSYGRTGIICFLLLLPLFIILKCSWNKRFFILISLFSSVIFLSFLLSKPLSSRVYNTITECNDLLFGVSLEKKITRHAEYMAKNNLPKSIEYWKHRILTDQNEKGDFIWLNHVKKTNNHNDTSIGKRISIWKCYFNEIKSHKFLGQGLGSVSNLQKTKSISRNPHNYYLFILIEGGIIGLLLCLNIFFTMISEYINDRNNVLKIIFPLLFLLSLLINDYLFIYNTIAFFSFFAFIIYSDDHTI